MNYITNNNLPNEDFMCFHSGDTLELYMDEILLLERIYEFRKKEPHGKRKLFDNQYVWFAIQQDMLLE